MRHNGKHHAEQCATILQTSKGLEPKWLRVMMIMMMMMMMTMIWVMMMKLVQMRMVAVGVIETRF